MTSKYRGMRNPLRRAYSQLSRLIVNEGFRDFANLCGFDPKDPNYQEVKNAYADIQSNNELKEFYKAKMAKDGINISNLDRALYDVSYDENLSRVEKFLADYKIYSASYKSENHIATLRREREKLKAKFAGNVVQQTSEYIVYKVDNFEDAKQMRWLWMGDVEKLTNEQCKKLDPNAPADSQSYKGNMTPKRMAEYMMSNNDFIMNPSWCVCAGEEHWNEYNCGETNNDGSASCHLIFSKIYPNCRFCVVKNDYNFEIRDPWQAGGFNRENKIQYGYDVMKSVFGNTVKQIACLHGVAEKIFLTQLESGVDKNDVEQMLEQGLLNQDIDPNYKDENGNPLIMDVVLYGEVKGCSLLLEYGADANVKDKYGKTSLHEAVYRGDFEICKLLLDHGAVADTKTESGKTPLHFATQNGELELCKLLLEYGAHVNVKDEDGETPLHFAAENGYTEICNLLLNHGADVNTKDNNVYTPLYMATRSGYTETCQLLMERGAEVNIKDKNGRTPLHRAVVKGYTYICKLLLEYGADVNAKDKHDYTPLHNSAFTDYAEICKLLLAHGADANVKNEDGETPLKLAMDYRRRDICELLRQYTTRD